jgi:oxygen-independent coproporphyrinogen-3 oxidase
MEHERRLGLYVHIPFCTAKCGYCDFNSYAGQESLIPAYAQALLQEAEMWSAACRPVGGGQTRPWRARLGGSAAGEGWRAETLFFGGGTPSLMPLVEVERILEGLRRHLGLTLDAEVTLEANPGTVDETYLSRLREMGVNRLSLGVQSFRDDELAFLGRIHSAKEARAAYRAARSAGFDNVSLDLIFGLPGQPTDRWMESLNEAINLGPEHLSLYPLTVEDGTPLARDVARGRTPAPDPDLQAELYLRGTERLAPAGYDQYEISNWARPGRHCRHNLTYWRNGFWLGLGAGAHSHLPGNWEPGARNLRQRRIRLRRKEPGISERCYRFAAEVSPRRYIELVNETWKQWSQEGTLTMDEMRQVTFREEAGASLELSDTLVLGLRLCDGVSVRELRRRFGQAALESHAAAFEEAVSLGLLERADGGLRLTARGRLLANEVFVRLLPPT